MFRRRWRITWSDADRWWVTAPSAPDPVVFASGIDALLPTLEAVRPSALPSFDAQLRHRRWSEPQELTGWFRVGPSDVAKIVRRSRDQTLAAALLSMHTNGYVREAAVRELRTAEPSRAFRFLLLRSADWVPEVRTCAAALLLDSIDRVSQTEILRALPLVERLSREGTRTAGVLPQIREDVVARLAGPELVAALSDADQRVRHASARLLVARDATDLAFEAALRQHDPLTALIVGRAVLAGAGPDHAEELDRLFASRFTVLAAEAAWQLIRSAPDGRAVAVSMLLDDRRAVRTTAQEGAQRHGVDTATYYRQHLNSHEVALVGLGECGGRADAAFVVPFLDDPHAPRRRAAVVAVGRLDPDGFLDELIAALDDPSPGIVRAASGALAGRDDPRVVTAVVGLTTETLDLPRRSATRRLARRMGRWPQLRVALRCCQSSDPEVRTLGTELIGRVLVQWNQSFTMPSSADRDEIDELSRDVGDRLPPTQRDALSFALARYLVRR